MNLRNVYPKRIGPTALAASAASIFEADKRYGIERFMLTNGAGTDGTASVYIVVSGGSPGATNAILIDGTVPANDMMIISFPIILNTGDRVYASSPDTINITFNVNDVEIGAQ